jgi:hypothetical protein
LPPAPEFLDYHEQIVWAASLLRKRIRPNAATLLSIKIEIPVQSVVIAAITVPVGTTPVPSWIAVCPITAVLHHGMRSSLNKGRFQMEIAIAKLVYGFWFSHVKSSLGRNAKAFHNY